MSDLTKDFEEAAASARNLPERPDNLTLLEMYALYKQATEGDISGSRPAVTDMVGSAKWNAWNELKGTSKDEAMQAYIELIDGLPGSSMK